MKTNISKIAIFIMLAVCTTGCNKNKVEYTTVLFPAEIYFFADETSKKSVSVITQGLIDWDFHYSADWFTVEVNKDLDYIYITPKTPNTDSSKRYAHIIITTIGYSPVILSVVQSGISGTK